MANIQKWEILPLIGSARLDPHLIKLNALGSLYYFAKFVLQRGRLTEHLHKPICENLERQRLNYLLELPRDHFKTTMMTEALPIWWSLPFTENDEAAMRELGYGDEWIRWMRFAHDPLIRILIVSEAALNAEKLGMRIDQHFYNNGRFRDLFPEIIPNEKSTWNASSKCVGGSKFRPHGEGTFDFIGVGGALQSRHYDRMIEDDLVGKDALRSEIVMNDTIEYHKLLEGAFDGPDHTELVVGNRWSPWDLNGWIRENEPEFVVESHSALGGCCPRHDPGTPILPEEFTIARLEKIRRRQGPYLFSHQYLNQAVIPDEIVFKPEWLRFYKPKADAFMRKVVKDGVITEIPSNRMLLEHEVVKGETHKDVLVNNLVRSMVVDPNHAGSEGRARHCILITGLDPDTDRIYLLDLWAQSMPYDDLMANVYRLAERWQMTEFHLETVAAQKYLKYHIEYRNKVEKRNLRCRELKTDRGKNAKWTRIDALSPLFEQGKIYVRRDQSAFLDEYYRYTHSMKHTVDILDCLGYAPQTWSTLRVREIAALKEERKARLGKRSKATGY
jgi:terminase large subunit-like protein